MGTNWGGNFRCRSQFRYPKPRDPIKYGLTSSRAVFTLNPRAKHASSSKIFSFKVFGNQCENDRKATGIRMYRWRNFSKLSKPALFQHQQCTLGSKRSRKRVADSRENRRTSRRNLNFGTSSSQGLLHFPAIPRNSQQALVSSLFGLSNFHQASTYEFFCFIVLRTSMLSLLCVSRQPEQQHWSLPQYTTIPVRNKKTYLQQLRSRCTYIMTVSSKAVVMNSVVGALRKLQKLLKVLTGKSSRAYQSYIEPLKTFQRSA